VLIVCYSSFLLHCCSLILAMSTKNTAFDAMMASPVTIPHPLARKDEYWSCIELVPPQDQQAPPGGWKAADCQSLYCKKCHLYMPYRIGNTRNAKEHMLKHHPLDVEAFRKAAAATPNETDPVSETAATVTPQKQRATATHKEKETMKHLCVKWLCTSLRPISAIEDKGLLEMVEYANETKHKLTLPSRKVVTAAIDEKATIARAILKHKLDEEMQYYCLTTDIWTSRAMESFISLTIHFVDHDFRLHKYLLEVKPFPGSHTGVMIASKIEDIMSDWGLDKKKLVLILRDNGANVALACRLLQVPSYGCIPHTINLVLAPVFFPRKKVEAAVNADTDPVMDPSAVTEYLDKMEEDDQNIIASLATQVRTL